MSAPTFDQIENANQYLVDNDWTLDEFFEYVEELDPADFRKYWGTVDVPLLRDALVSRNQKSVDREALNDQLTPIRNQYGLDDDTFDNFVHNMADHLDSLIRRKAAQ